MDYLNIVVVMSRDRAGVLPKLRKHTMMYLQHSQYPVYFVTRKRERLAYDGFVKKYGAQPIIVPDEVDTLAKTCDWVFGVLKEHHKTLRLVLMDDDLRFYKRNDEVKTFIDKLPEENIDEIIDLMFKTLDEDNVSIVGLTPKSLGNKLHPDKSYNQKIQHCIACDLGKLEGINWRWEGDSYHDIHFTLSALYSGQLNVRYANYVYNPSIPHLTAGGCEYYKTPADYEQATRKLARKFPEVVKLRPTKINGVGRGVRPVVYIKKKFGADNES